MHVVIMGCGRVGLDAGAQPRGPQATPSPSSTSEPDAFRRLGAGVQRRHGHRRRLRPRRSCSEAGIEEADAFAAVSSGDNSNIIAARVARETFGVEQRRRPHLRPRPGRGLPAARHPDRRHGALDRRPDAAPAAAGGRRAGVARPVAARVRLAEVPVDPALGRPARPSTSRQPTGARVAFIDPARRGHAARTATRVLQEGDLRPRGDARGGRRLERRRRSCDRRRPRGVQLMRVAIAGAGSGRPLDRPRADRERPRGPAHRQGPDARSSRERVPDARVAARRRLRARLAARRPASTSATSSIAATGDDKVNLVVSLLAKTEFGVPRIVARVNHPKNEWMFNEAWGVDVAVSTPRMMSALVEEAVTRRRPGPALHVPAGQRQPGRADAARRLAVRREAGSATCTWPAGHGAGRRSSARTGRSRPAADDALEAGDELLFVTVPESEDKLQELLSPGTASSLTGSATALRLRRLTCRRLWSRRSGRRRRRPGSAGGTRRISNQVRPTASANSGRPSSDVGDAQRRRRRRRVERHLDQRAQAEHAGPQPGAPAGRRASGARTLRQCRSSPSVKPRTSPTSGQRTSAEIA